MSALIIQEPPLQVLPSLAIAIGLNEALVLQQLHYLLRDPRFGKRLAEEQWIFNTVEQWRASYFPFWSERTIKTIFSNLRGMGLVQTCQPEGRLSRRQYYRINTVKLDQICDGAKFVSSKGQELPDGKGQNSSLPITKTTAKTSSQRKSKESPTKSAASDKSSLLLKIVLPSGYPLEEEFDDFTATLDHVASRVSNLYARLVADKWHRWDGKRWTPIKSWKAYVRGLDAKVDGALAR